MPASITLSNISWSTPDGRTILDSIDLSFGPERTGLIGRNGVGKSTLFAILTGTREPQTGTLAISGTLGILRQTVQVEKDATIADLFGVGDNLDLLARAEAGEATAEQLADADWTLPARLDSALERMGLSAAPQTPLAALSGGQRTRAALAALILSEPDFLLLDEPTNNLDREGREAVIDLLASWRGGAIVISHDRELLGTMDAIVELTALGATRYGGKWSLFQERKASELAAAERDLADAEKRAENLARDIQLAAERKARRGGAGQKKRARNDAPKMLLDKKKDRSEATGGAGARLADRRSAQAQKELELARQRIEILTPFKVTLAATGLPPDKMVLRLEGISAGYEGAEPILRDLSFEVRGPERIALTGPNGTGKTSLLNLIAARMAPMSGRIELGVDLAYLDQSVSLLDPTLSIRDNFLAINPGANENACRAALARFMFRADASLQTVSSLSGGQMLRAGLACAIGSETPPQLLILDEPTSHLDIDAIATVEAGLRAYDGALIVVSHDEGFLDAIGVERRFELDGGTCEDVKP